MRFSGQQLKTTYPTEFDQPKPFYNGFCTRPTIISSFQNQWKWQLTIHHVNPLSTTTRVQVIFLSKNQTLNPNYPHHVNLVPVATQMKNLNTHPNYPHLFDHISMIPKNSELKMKYPHMLANLILGNFQIGLRQLIIS